jgi:RNA polymerase sigma factor (sigma-70 family)
VAWEELARSYWFPVYAYVRRRGSSMHDAEDLTQDFFAQALDKDYLSAADPARGRFRAFLRVLVDRFLMNAHDRRTAAKRGGRQSIVSFDALVAEQRYAAEPVDAVSPDRIFERRWALAVWERALVLLKRAYAEGGREAEFEVLKGCLAAGRGETEYGALAARLGVSEGAARVAVHRLRKRLREAFHEAVAETLDEGEDVDAERRHLVGLLGET